MEEVSGLKAETQQDTRQEMDLAAPAPPSPAPSPCQHHFPTGDKPAQVPAPESPTWDWLYRRESGKETLQL